MAHRRISIQRRREITDALAFSSDEWIKQNTYYSKRTVTAARDKNRPNYVISNKQYNKNWYKNKYITHNKPVKYNSEISLQNRFSDSPIEINKLEFSKPGDGVVELIAKGEGAKRYVSSGKHRSVKEAEKKLRERIEQRREFYYITYGIDLTNWRLSAVSSNKHGERIYD